MKRAVMMLSAVLVTACEQSQPPAQPAPVAEANPAAMTQPPPLAAASPRARDPLPREIAGITLGASVSDAQAALGPLECHDNPAGFRVCSPTAPPPGAPRRLEVYCVHDHIVSLAYESDIGANVWDFLSDLIGRYGRPSLNGANERDTQGRVHELYGWKDDRSLYSVRFVWQGETAESRQLTATAITLWDRDAYHQWEAETKRAKETPPVTGEPT